MPIFYQCTYARRKASDFKTRTTAFTHMNAQKLAQLHLPLHTDEHSGPDVKFSIDAVNLGALPCAESGVLVKR